MTRQIVWGITSSAHAESRLSHAAKDHPDLEANGPSERGRATGDECIKYAICSTLLSMGFAQACIPIYAITAQQDHALNGLAAADDICAAAACNILW